MKLFVLQTVNTPSYWKVGFGLFLFITTAARTEKMDSPSGLHGPKEIEIDLRQEMQNISRKLGNKAKFLCDIIGQPIPEFRWYKDGTKIDVEGKFKIDNELWGSQLKIDNVQEEDAGQYTCSAHNKGGSINTTAYLRVISDSRKKPDNLGEGSDGNDINQENSATQKDRSLFPSTSERRSCEKFKSGVCGKYRSDKWVSLSAQRTQVELEQVFGLWLASWSQFKEWSTLQTECFENLMRRLCLYHWPECVSFKENYPFFFHTSDHVEDPQTGQLFRILPLCQEECKSAGSAHCHQEEDRMASYLSMKFPQLAYNCSSLPLFKHSNNDNLCYISNTTLIKLSTNTETHSGITIPGSKSFVGPLDDDDAQLRMSRSLLITFIAVGSFLATLVVLLIGWCMYNNSACCTRLRPDSTIYGALAKKKKAFQVNSPKCNGGELMLSPYSIVMNGTSIDQTVNIVSKVNKDASGSEASKHFRGNDVTEIGENGMSSQPREFPLSQIRLGEKVGVGIFGPIFRGELVGFYKDTSLTPVIVKTLFVSCATNNETDPTLQDAENLFRVELSTRSSMKHDNILTILGVSLRQNPRCILYEHLPYGDLHEYLVEQRVPTYSHIESGRLPIAYSSEELLTTERDMSGCLSYQMQLFVVCQIASGLEYIHTHHLFIHKDIATRNILLGERFICKIGDLALAREKYVDDYYQLHQSSTSVGNRRIPLRWMSPEAILYGQFSSASDVWSFGVLLWEVWTSGASQPYNGFSNTEVVELIRKRQLLNPPEHCPANVYAMMLECWSELPQHRPNMDELNTRLHRWKDEVLHSAASHRRPIAPQQVPSPNITYGEDNYSTPIPHSNSQQLESVNGLGANVSWGSATQSTTVYGVDCVPLLGVSSPSGHSGGSGNTHSTQTGPSSCRNIYLPPPPRTLSLPLPPPYEVVPTTPLFQRASEQTQSFQSQALLITLPIPSSHVPLPLINNSDEASPISSDSGAGTGGGLHYQNVQCSRQFI